MRDSDKVEGGPEGQAERIVELERLDTNLYRNRFSAYARNDHLFGGQVLAQALAAASATVDAPPHSLHGYFLRAGSARRPVIFQVERTRDGRSFSTRRVVALQDAQPIFHMECSFHGEEAGFEHQSTMPPGLTDPDQLPTIREAIELYRRQNPDRYARSADERIEMILAFNLIEIRLADPTSLFTPETPATRKLWIRVPSASGIEDPAVHLQLLAYLSDYWLSATVLVPHPIRLGGSDLFMTSLDHAMWFHRPARVDEWLLYDTDSPSASNATGLARGTIYDRSGRLVASVAQEALIRRR
ncbi:acyl-CoA thioesterase II [Sphingomonas sp. MG17]|uniref:Acyl-CoA thioesterase 2 n=1 Tax=Sphingomonas tagetis TaxID=2949092 RepID=A0A9X2HK93_9SPHN|nr:acyl-CoA thioesterase II [Sphingomonas tagetis]MCP3731257.1 acyl-CoA thioesterase II [Sphingomonas tagetis]